MRARACVRVYRVSLPPSLPQLTQVSQSLHRVDTRHRRLPPARRRAVPGAVPGLLGQRHVVSQPCRPPVPSFRLVRTPPSTAAGGRTRLSVASSFSAGESAGTRARSTRGGGGGDGGGGGGVCGERKEGGRDDVSAASKGDESPTRLSTVDPLDRWLHCTLTAPAPKRQRAKSMSNTHRSKPHTH